MTSLTPGDLGEDPQGATPIDEEQMSGLIPSWIATRADLNEAEADNILLARQVWRRRAQARGQRRLTLSSLLDHVTLRKLHKDMYGDVWDWAGKYRLVETTIGVQSWKIPGDVANLLADAQYWFAGATPMPVDVAACRLHHKLVEIHPFPNGNGRHAREFTDLVLLSVGATPFTWGRVNLTTASATRRTYTSALAMADIGQYDQLEAFVRT